MPPSTGWTATRPFATSTSSSNRTGPSSSPPAAPPARSSPPPGSRSSPTSAPATSAPSAGPGSSTYSHPKERHQDVLARSPFSNVETARWDRTVTRTLDEVIGLQFSYSYSSPAQLGDDKDAFEHDLRQALTDFSPTGAFDEVVRTEAIIATRP